MADSIQKSLRQIQTHIIEIQPCGWGDPIKAAREDPHDVITRTLEYHSVRGAPSIDLCKFNHDRLVIESLHFLSSIEAIQRPLSLQFQGELTTVVPDLGVSGLIPTLFNIRSE